jgi:ribosomal protein S12 methylthiotransferase accessory factor
MPADPGPGLLDLVSVDVGPINRIDEGLSRYDHPRLASCIAHPCDTAPLFGVRTTGTAGGIAPDLRRARLTAVGEALERYSAQQLPVSRMRVATRRELGERRPVVDSDWVEATDHPPDPSQHWVPGTQLAADGPGRAAWIASSRVYLAALDDLADVSVTTSTGLALHTDPWQALRAGLLEVIERDAVMVSWLTRAGGRELATSLRWTDECGVSVRFDRAVESYRTFLLDSPTGIPVVFAVAFGSEHQPPVAVGAAAHPEVGHASRKALIEARQTFDWCRFMLSGGRPVPALDAIGDLEDHVACYLDPARLVAFEHLTALTPQGDVDLDRCSPGAAAGQARADVSRIVRSLQQCGLASYAVDVTAADVRAGGGWVVRAIVPGLYPLTVGAGARPDHPRLRGAHPVNPYPHPFP